MGYELTERQKEVLINVVKFYIKENRPVSSEDVLSFSEIKASSATIRNDMQKLQKLKYIYQQHTSGGRIPTDKALKIYFEIIEEVYSKKNLSLDIPKEYKFYDLNLMFENISKIVSNLLRGMVIFEYPDPKYIIITRAVVAPLTDYNYVVTLLTNLGMTISRTVEVYGLPGPHDLEKMLNEGLMGKSLMEIYRAFGSKDIKTDDLRVLNMYDLIEALLNEFSRNKYIVSGFEKLISNYKPNIDTLESLSMLVENDEIKEEIFSQLDFSRDIKIFFGNEISSKSLRNYAFFYSSYCMDMNSVGRMVFVTNKYTDYEKTYTVIKEYLSRFSEIISKNL
ncbi:MAG: hypothetical protein H7A30_00660 [Thermotogae bacterium]|nr:hypothetical protein [Thermotogota bacterium]